MYTQLIKLVEQNNSSIVRVETLNDVNYAIIVQEDNTPMILVYNKVNECWE